MLLWKKGAPFAKSNSPEDQPRLEPFINKSERRHAAIVICPGGGYARRAEHEGAPIAKWLNSLGLSAFVLHYRVSPYKHPVPLLDVQRALRVIRFYADRWNIDKNRIGIIGFSAGGHLAACSATLFEQKIIEETDKIDKEEARPDLAILCYPVISFREFVHEGSMMQLLGDASDENIKKHLSLDRQVSEKTPPIFLWHTADDASVPVENSLLFARSLREKNIPFELHIYQTGRHGLGLANEKPEVAQWKGTCEVWLKKQGFF